MKQVLIIHGALSFYRVDFFNDVTQQLPEAHIVFLMGQVPAQVSQKVSIKDLNTAFQYTIATKKTFKRWAPLQITVFALPALIRILLKQRPDTVVTHEFGPLSLLMAGYCFLSGRRHIAWTDDSLDIVMQCSRFRRLRRKLVLQLSTGLIVCNPIVRDYFKIRFHRPVKSVEILQKETTFRQCLQTSVPTAAGYINQYHLSGKKVILFVGRLVGVKNLPALIQAFSRAADEQAVLVLVGSGASENELQADVKKFNISGRVIFTGEQSREALWAWYLIGGLFVLPSLFEPFGAVVNEALLAGMPVLCSKHAGAACLIDSGTNGEVFCPEYKQEFVSVLSQRLARIEPVSAPVRIRDSLMKLRYDETVEKFVSMCAGHDVDVGT